MKKAYLLFAAAIFMMCSCTTTKPTKTPFKPDVYIHGAVVRVDTLTWFDSSRNRIIPLAIYNRDYLTNAKDQLHTNISKPLVILNPGYGGTRGGYRYIANNLALNGYLVVTIQHDLPADDSLPKTGDIYKLRKPFWDRGVKTIFFVTEKLKKEYPKLDYHHIILIGHSNGGDIAMLIANEYPNFAQTVITHDNRRVPFPRSSNPKILSIRSGDQPADPNVLPSAEGQEKYRIKIVKVATKHNDMGGMATDAEKKEINDYIMDFLKNN